MQYTQMTNLRRLYNYAEYDLLASCGALLSEAAEKLVRSIGREPLRRLEAPVREFDLWFSRGTYGSFDSVGESIMSLVGVDRYVNRIPFMEAWNRGPCARVMHVVNERDGLPLLDYVKMLAETQVFPLHLSEDVDLVTIGAVSIVRFCHHFRSDAALLDLWKLLQTGDSRERATYQRMRNQLTVARIRRRTTRGDAPS